jgi:hypothetical protein
MDLANHDQQRLASSQQTAARRGRYDRRGTALGIAALALLGVGLALAASRHGVGASPDSVVYIGVARNLLAGRGLTEPFGALVDTPLTRYPPLYPALLAAGGPLGLDPLATARWISALLFGVNILFVGLALATLLPRARWLPVVGALLAASGLPLLTMHSMAWSEPLFLLLNFLSLLALAAYLDQGRPAALVLAGALGGLALLTRYAAFPLVAVGVLGLLFMGTAWRDPAEATDWSRGFSRFWRRDPAEATDWSRGFSRFWRRDPAEASTPRGTCLSRPACAALFAGLALLPAALWTVRNVAVADTAAARVLAWHPAGKAQLWQALYTVAGWLHVPDRAPDWLRLGLLLAVAAAAATMIFTVRRGRPERPVASFIKLLVLWIPLYLAFLAASISLLDASTPLDDRILAPLYVATIFLALYAVGELLPLVAHPRRWQAGLAALLLLLVGGSAIKGASWVNDGYRQGIGFSSLAWQRSPLIQQVRLAPPETVIYSNVPEAIYLHADRRALPLPRPMNATTQQPNPGYAAELIRMGQMLDTQGLAVLGRTASPAQAALLVYARGLSQRSRPSEEELRQQLALHLLAQCADGAIYAGGAAH